MLLIVYVGNAGIGMVACMFDKYKHPSPSFSTAAFVFGSAIL